MAQRKTPKNPKIDWKSPRQVGRYGALLWAIVVLGTLAGSVIQALVAGRAWASIPGAILPVFLGATIGYLLTWGASLLAANRSGDSSGAP